MLIVDASNQRSDQRAGLNSKKTNPPITVSVHLNYDSCFLLQDGSGPMVIDRILIKDAPTGCNQTCILIINN